jgi:hypothetical protein
VLWYLLTIAFEFEVKLDEEDLLSHRRSCCCRRHCRLEPLEEDTKDGRHLLSLHLLFASMSSHVGSG